MTLSAREANETRPLRTGSDVAPEDAAARAESRRRPATWAGFRPVILRSTSTIVVQQEITRFPFSASAVAKDSAPERLGLFVSVKCKQGKCGSEVLLGKKEGRKEEGTLACKGSLAYL